MTLSLRAATYHIDSATGDDARDGASPERAWKTLDRVNRQTFAPGDALLFKAGTRYEGRLALSVSNKSKSTTAPVTLSQYGSGPLPRIDGGGRFPEAVLLRNVEFCDVRNLEVTNFGASRAPGRVGVRVIADGFGAMRHIHLSDLFVHRVNGDLRKSQEGCGIFFETAGGHRSHFEGMLIERCHVAQTDRNGICQRGLGGARSTGVVVRENLLEDIGGDAIKVWGCDGAIVERNVVRGARQRCEDAAAGIWPWDCDDTLIQYNEVSGLKGTSDGQGFDADYRCRRTLIQYNYSHDNEGGFLLVCAPASSYCQGTVVRYNISQNDGLPAGRVIQIGGGPNNTLIYNNTIYLDPGQHLPLVSFNEWDGAWARQTRFVNNIFYVAGKADYRPGASRETVFESNAFYGSHAHFPNDARAVTAAPPLGGIGTGAEGFSSLGGYRWKPGANPPRGVPIAGAPAWDIFGSPVPTPPQAPCLGAAELTGPNARARPAR